MKVVTLNFHSSITWREFEPGDVVTTLVSGNPMTIGQPYTVENSYPPERPEDSGWVYIMGLPALVSADQVLLYSEAREISQKAIIRPSTSRRAEEGDVSDFQI